MPKHAIGYGGSSRVRTLEFLGATSAIVVKLNGVNITDYVLACRTERGKDEELGYASAGICELTLDNFNGDFSPENAAGAFYGDLDLGMVVEVYETYNGTDYYHFTGKVDTIEPHGEPDNLTAYLLAVDGIDDLSGEEKVHTPMRTNTRTDILVGDVLDAVGDSNPRSLETGIDTLQLGWLEDITGIEAIRLLEQIEQGFFYIDVDGTRVWENRHHRWLGNGLVSQHDFEDSLIEFVPQYSKKLVKNHIQVTGYKYVPATTPSLIWSTYAGGAGAPYIPAGGSLTLWAVFSKPLYDYTTPVANRHWNANTTPVGTGADVTSDITLTVTPFGQRLKLEFQNGGSSGAYLVPPYYPPEDAADKTCLVYGRLYTGYATTLTESDSTSITKHGRRTLTLDLPFKSNVWDLKNQAEWLRDRFKTVIPQPTVRLNAGTDAPSDEIKSQMLMRKISDRITIKSTKLGTDKDYFINKIVQDYKLQEGGMIHETYWVLQEATDPDLYWLLGVEDYGELGLETVLGF